MEAATVAAFVDVENVGANFVRPVAEFAATRGRLCHLAVYADWRRGYGEAWSETLELGGVPKQVLRTRGSRNSADIAIVIDVMEMLAGPANLDVFVLATSDSDFVVLAQKLRARGKTVIGVAPLGANAAEWLVSACDTFQYLSMEDREEGLPLSKTPPLTEEAPPRPAELKGPARKEAAKAIPPATPLRPSLEQIRTALRDILSEQGPLLGSEIGRELLDVIPDLDLRALGYKTLSDLLRAQADLLKVEPSASDLRVRLSEPAPRVKEPPRAARDLPQLDRVQWLDLRDYLLAVLLQPSPAESRTDRDIIKDAEALAGRENVSLARVSLDDVVSRYPTLFERSPDKTFKAKIDLVTAYQLRIKRVRDLVPRQALRRILAIVMDLVAQDGVFPCSLPRLADLLMGQQEAEPEFSRSQARTVITLIARLNGWKYQQAQDGEEAQRLLAPAPWLTAAAVEDRLDKGLLKRMNPFAPVDPHTLAAALGCEDREELIAKWLAEKG